MVRTRISSVAMALLWYGTIVANELPEQAIVDLQTVVPGDDGNRTAVAAVARFKNASVADLLPVLRAMKDATPVGRNYLAMVANSLYRKGGDAIETQLEEFLNNPSHDGEARYMVLQWLTAKDIGARNTRLMLMTEDPSLELRFAAIDLVMKEAQELSDPDQKMAKLNELFDSARQPAQVIALAKALNDLGRPVDMNKHFGFVTSWNLIGPFDNMNEAHFDTVYDVERDLLEKTSDTSLAYDGKHDKVRWLQHTTDNQEGVVNVAELFNKEKGAIVYAYQKLDFDENQNAELRLGTINANKAWWNGELITANKVYHSAMEIDQYVGQINVKPGANHLVLKLCQNEQTQNWAQDWKFQIRVCDSNGTAVTPKSIP